MIRRRPRLGRLERRGDVPGLTAAMRHRDIVAAADGRRVDVGVPVRERAAQALGRVGGHAANEALFQALNDEALRVRRAALSALASRPEPEAAEAIATAAMSWTGPGADELRAETARVLGTMGIEGATMAAGIVRAYVLHEGDGTAADTMVEMALDAVVSGEARAAAIDAAIEAFDSGELGSSRAVRVLARWPAESFEPLLAALSRCAAPVSVATALGELRDARATPALIGLLDVDDAVTRRAAAYALGQIQDPRAVDALLHASSDPDHSVRAAALGALAAFGPAVALFGAVGLMRVLEREGWTHTDASAPTSRQSALTAPVGAHAPEARPAITGAAKPGRRRRPWPLSMLGGWIPDVRRRVSG